MARESAALTGIPPPLLAALREVPRELFRPPAAAPDGPLPAPDGETLRPAETIAKMIDALQLAPASRVLEVGGGTGYVAAILGRVAGEVFTAAPDASSAASLRRKLERLRIGNVRVREGDAAAGWPEMGPFDWILVSAAGMAPPRSLREQLAVGGRLVLPAGANRSRQTLVRVHRRSESCFLEERLGEIRLVRRLGDILADLGLVEPEAVERAALEAAGRRRIGEALREVARVDEADIFRVLAAQRGIGFATAEALLRSVDLEAVRSIPRPFQEHHRLVPVGRTDHVLKVATCEPDPPVADLAKVFHPSSPDFCLVTPADYRRLRAAVDLMLNGEPAPSPPPPAAPSPDLASARSPEESHFVQLFETLLLDAIGERASDIHLERSGDRIRVRLRVDGDLRDLTRYRLGPHELVGVLNVLKIRAELDIAEHRLPQGGRIRVRAGGRPFDLRVQTQPSLYGEHAVVRILPQDVRLLTIEDLGFPPEVASEYRRILEQPSGLVLVVGPTGSGKTTTLYAGLQILARDATRKVITVEDPIEYAIENVQQTQARPDIGFAFADAMRAFLREDPDVILIGEIRDGETALEAIRASQTGHLVFSTLHCNDTVDAVQRLHDLGMHPNSIAGELVAVMSQRLARRVCPGCRREADPDPVLLGQVFPGGPPPEFRSFRGEGCPKCGGFGTFGRVACVEFLRATPAMRIAISRGHPLDELRAIALEAGLRPMRRSALELVAEGQIPFSELPSILPAERLSPEPRPGGPGRGPERP